MARLERLAKEAFPPEEYLAPAELLKMQQEGGLDLWGLYDAERFAGFMAVKRWRQLAYLFFLAIEQGARGRGYGSRALETLRTIYPGAQQVVDLEMLDPAAPNQEQRERRRRFYLRGGYKPTGLFLSYLGVDYEVLCGDDAFDEAAFREMMSNLKVEGFAPRYFRR